MPYEVAVDRVVTALKEQGFGVLTEIDVKSTLREKLGVDFRKYIILGACNPPLAHRALGTDLSIGLLLPCNVIVYETEHGSEVAIVDPISMLGIVQAPELEQVAEEARERLASVVDSLQA